MPRPEDNFEDTISCFHLHVAPRDQTQVVRTIWQVFLPSDHFASPYLASFLMYWLQVELLNFLKQYKLLSCMKTKAWECSVYNTVHIVVFLLGCSQRSYGSREQRRQAHSLAGSLWRCLDFRQMTAAPYPPSLSSLHA